MAWYEEAGPNSKEVTQMLFDNLKINYDNHTQLNKYINEIIGDTTDFGSYRGYATFFHDKYKKDIIEKFAKQPYAKQPYAKQPDAKQPDDK